MSDSVSFSLSSLGIFLSSGGCCHLFNFLLKSMDLYITDDLEEQFLKC